MIGLIITGHNKFGEGVLSSLEMIAGKSDEVIGINFLESESLETLSNKYISGIETLKKTCDGVLICCDLAGGTPFNTSVLIAKNDSKVVTIAGANLATLLQLSIMRQQYDNPVELAKLSEEQENNVVQFKTKVKVDTDEGGI